MDVGCSGLDGWRVHTLLPHPRTRLLKTLSFHAGFIVDLLASVMDVVFLPFESAFELVVSQILDIFELPTIDFIFPVSWRWPSCAE